ncbi:MAG: SDR family NAD(P)-dependent oxidoreductase, partial [Patescibacteria group bacterium]
MLTKTAVILAAGQGGRLDSSDSPKPLVKVGHKPMIIHNIEHLQQAGIEEIYIVIGYRGEEIRKELTNNPDVTARLNYIEQTDASAKGMLNSVLSLVGKVEGPFFLTMADLILENNPYPLFHDIKTNFEDNSILALVSTDKGQIERSAGLSRVIINNEKITSVGRDLPYYSGLQIGIYYFKASALEMLKEYQRTNPEIDDFDEMLDIVAKENKLTPVIYSQGEWFDVNIPSTHIRAEIFMRKLKEVSIIPKSRSAMQEFSEFSSFKRVKNLETKILIEAGIINRLKEVRIIPESMADSPHYLLTDTVVDKLYGEIALNGLLNAGYKVRKIVIPTGEETKNLTQYEKLADEIFSYGIDEHSIIISLGGGVINNIAGFLASTLYRGIGLIHIPTTMMAQVDAAIDFKQAVNSTKGKNLFGSYYPAMSIIIDPKVLLSLDERHINNGIAEAVKHAITQDREFLNYLDNNFDKFRDINFLEVVIRKTIELKVPLLDGDTKEDFNEMLPQYGHAVGHAVEHLSAYELLHGEATAIGMCVSAEIAKLLHIGSVEAVQEHYLICEKYKLPTIVPDNMAADDIINTIRYDKHYLKGNPHMALVKEIGQTWHDKNIYSLPIDYEILKKAININKERKQLNLKGRKEEKVMAKNIIVTGGSKGIGKAIAKKLLEQGYHVCICARHEDELKRATEELSAFGQVDSFVLDLASREAVENFIFNWDQPLYALVNNAG